MCQYTAADAVLALNKIYMTMHEKSPQGGRFMMRWARVLLRPELRQPQMACDVLESVLHGEPGDPVLPAGKHEGDVDPLRIKICILTDVLHTACM